LTIEPGTALDHFVKRGKAQPVDDEKSAHQFEVLMQMMESNDYHHYEISNFAKPGNYARHNSNYWSGVSYLGVGPSAHSFNGKSRQWNIANNALYLKAIDFDKNNINEKGSRFEVEILSLKQQYNEYIMTALRTMWGCNLGKIRTWGDDFEKYFLKSSEVFLKNGTLKQDRGSFVLTKKGKLLADNIAMELFFET
jgi:oxygen-independent coproporphyrinogen-3 oxidase